MQNIAQHIFNYSVKYRVYRAVCACICVCVWVWGVFVIFIHGEHLTKGCAIKLRLIMPTMNVNQLESNISVYIKISALLIYAAHTHTHAQQSHRYKFISH